MSDFVNATYAIPQATMDDYVSCFQRALEDSDVAYDTECTCDLVKTTQEPHESGAAWTLQFVIALEMLNSTWEPTHEFTLTPIVPPEALELLDVLVVQLRDVQNEVAALRVSKAAAPKLDKWTLETPADIMAVGGLLVWKSAANHGATNDLVCVECDGQMIRFVRSRVYWINLKVLHQKCSRDDVCRIELQFDDHPSQSCAFPFTTDSGVASRHSVMVPVAKGQVLRVQKCCRAIFPKGSSLTLSLVN